MRASPPSRPSSATSQRPHLSPTCSSWSKLRASQINGCAFCIDMHTKDARADGETEQRLYALNAWRETPFYTDRERAALAWTEAVFGLMLCAPRMVELMRRSPRGIGNETI